MPTLVQGVQSTGISSDLHALIGQWNLLRGAQWAVRATDYVGGSFDVEFSRRDGNVSEDEAQAWVASTMMHAGE